MPAPRGRRRIFVWLSRLQVEQIKWEKKKKRVEKVWGIFFFFCLFQLYLMFRRVLQNNVAVERNAFLPSFFLAKVFRKENYKQLMIKENCCCDLWRKKGKYKRTALRGFQIKIMVPLPGPKIATSWKVEKGKDVMDVSPLLFVFKDVLTQSLLFYRTQSSSHPLNILNELNFLKKQVIYKQKFIIYRQSSGSFSSLHLHFSFVLTCPLAQLCWGGGEVTSKVQRRVGTSATVKWIMPFCLFLANKPFSIPCQNVCLPLIKLHIFITQN